MKKKKIIITIILLILGIGLMSYGIYSYLHSMNNKKEEEVTNNTSSQENYDSTNNDDLNETKIEHIPITNNSNSKDYNKELCVFNFIKEKKEDILSLNFNIINNTENLIINKELKINLYNENELVNSFEYIIEELDTNDEIGVETDIELEKQVTRYEFEVDNYKTEVKPIEK